MSDKGLIHEKPNLTAGANPFERDFNLPIIDCEKGANPNFESGPQMNNPDLAGSRSEAFENRFVG